MTRQLLLVGLYVAALIAGVLLFNADAENNWTAFAIWAVASVMVGWGLARWSAALLPSLSIPIAVPFGYADEYLGSDAPYVWWFAVVAGVAAAALILAATGARKLYNRRRASVANGA